jgi:Transporter associated domain/Protein-L-isoaspartate(D-aspartate) O-methyltransferase (PCMT)
MVASQLARRGVTDERVLEAMREVPREAFVGAGMEEFAYEDSPLPGDLPELDIEAEPKITRRDDGSLLIDATMPIAEVAELLGISELSGSDFLTLAGFVLLHLDHLPLQKNIITGLTPLISIKRRSSRTKIELAIVLAIPLWPRRSG